MKNLFLVGLLFFYSVLTTSAQDNISRQLQKSEAFVSAGGLVFIDSKSLISAVKEMHYNDFITYRANQMKINSFIELDKPTFDFTQRNPAKWGHGNMIVEKNGAYSKIGYLGIRQNIEISYVTFDKEEVIINLKFNDEPLRQIKARKNSVQVIPVGLLDPTNKKTNGYLALQFYDFGLQRNPCSLDEIVDDIINKEKPPICS